MSRLIRLLSRTVAVVRIAFQRAYAGAHAREVIGAQWSLSRQSASAGPSRPDSFPDARGNSRRIEYSLFCLSGFLKAKP